MFDSVYGLLCVEKEVKDMGVSKHSAHVKEMERVIKGDYSVCLTVFSYSHPPGSDTVTISIYIYP